MMDTITKRWKAGLKWDREVAPKEEHEYLWMANANALRWLQQAAAGAVPSGGQQPTDPPTPYLDYTQAERPGAND